MSVCAIPFWQVKIMFFSCCLLTDIFYSVFSRAYNIKIKPYRLMLITLVEYFGGQAIATNFHR